MRTLRLAGSSLQAMASYRLRSALVMLGVFAGVGALTLVVAAGQAVQRKMLSTVRQLFGDSSIFVLAGGRTLMGGPRAESARLTLEDVEEVARRVPEVSLFDAQQSLGNVPVKHGERTATARVLGQTERWTQAWERRVVRGEDFDAADLRSSARVAVLGETTAMQLFGDADPLGAEVRVGTVPLRVIGVMERFGTDLHGMDRDAEIVVPLTTAMRRLINTDTIGGAKLLISHEGDVGAVAERVRALLRHRHGLVEGQRDDFNLIRTDEVQRTATRVRRVLFLLLPLAAALVLAASGAIASALMLASVGQRRAEIGLRRAVGARPEDIGLQFILEAAATTLAGGLAGVAAGLLAARAIAIRWTLGPITPWSAIALGLGLSIAVGLLAGLLPARRAARIPPAEALR